MRFSGISIRQLEAFEAFMEAHSVSGAAERLRISQPSVSRLLQDLEADTRLALFDRRGGRLVPTQQALLFSAEVSSTFRSARNLMKVADEIRDMKRGTVKIGTLAALSFEAVPHALTAMKGPDAETSIVITVRHSRDIAAAVAAGVTDVGLVDHGIPTSDTIVVAVHELNSVCVLDENHPLAVKRTISMDDISRFPFATLDPDYYARSVDGMELNRTVRKKIAAEAFQSFVACAFVRNTQTLSVVDPFTARFYQSHGLIQRPIDFVIPFRIAVIQNELSASNVVAMEFIRALQQEFASCTPNML